MLKAKDILNKTLDLVTGSRSKQNGDIEKNHSNIARLWTAYLTNKGIVSELTPLDVAIMMSLLKIARSQGGKYNVDDYIDLVGYGSIAGELAENVNSK